MPRNEAEIVPNLDFAVRTSRSRPHDKMGQAVCLPRKNWGQGDSACEKVRPQVWFCGEVANVSFVAG